LKRPSGASSKPPELVFFIDRSLGKHKVARALRQAGVRVEIHDDHFAPDAKDADWLRVAGERRWIVLTKDDRIRYRPHEKSAMLSSRARVFILTNRNLSGDEMAEIFVKMLPKMQKLALTARSGFVATLNRNTVRVVAEARK
jgi:predicted nuclease of predicted toxin-antitoxin system